MSWALNDAPDVPPEQVAVLVGLANHADEDGRHAFPSQARLARYARKSDRSVRNDLTKLLTLGLIRDGDQRLVSHIPAGRRPKVYDLAMERRAEAHDRKLPSTLTGSPLPPTPDVDDRSPRTPASDKPSLNPSTSSSTEGDSPARTRDAADPDRGHEPAVPPPAAGRPIPPDRKAELQRMGDDARAAVAAARVEAAATDVDAIAACTRCDQHGLLPSRTRCLHPKERPEPGSARAAAHQALASRSCTSCGTMPGRCLDAPLACCPECSHTAEQLSRINPDRWAAKRARLEGRDPGVEGAVSITPAEAPSSPCPTCERTNGHLPGCPDAERDRAAAEGAVIDQAIRDGRLPLRSPGEPEPGPDDYEPSTWGPDDPPF